MTGRTRIKVCGVRDEATIDACVAAGADAIGFMFVKGSPRYIAPERGFELLGYLSAAGPFVAGVGVTANLDVDRFADLEQVCPTAISQLHGNETDETVRRCGPGVIKAIRFDTGTIADELKRWDAIEEVDAILVDGSAGGTGETFDWEQLAQPMAAIAKPVIVAGGLTPDNVGEAIRTLRPYGVDVSSGVEREKGVKDTALIAAFGAAVRAADA
ncbi:MAG: phosphoribosylanthranilate isomerase [Planctomycetota bacterium]